MPQIIVTAAVNDVEEWLKFKADMVPALSAVALMGPATSPWMAVTRSPARDVPDMEAFQAAQGSFSPELAAAAERRHDPIDDGGVHQEVDRPRPRRTGAIPGSEAAEPHLHPRARLLSSLPHVGSHRGSQSSTRAAATLRLIDLDAQAIHLFVYLRSGSITSRVCRRLGHQADPAGPLGSLARA